MQNRTKTRGWGDKSTPLYARVLITILMILMTVTFLYPLFYMLINSFKTATEYYSSQFTLPAQLNLANYARLLNEFKILRYFRNSLFISVVSTVLVIGFSIFASYAFAKINFRGKNFVYFLIICTMFVPSQAVLIPQYVMFSKYHMINTPWSVIMAYLAAGIPSAVLLLRTAFLGIPNELIESARIDGAGYFTVVLGIASPICMAAISIQSIFSFITHWNDLLTPMLMLSDQSSQTVMVALSTLMSRYGSEPSIQLTGLLLSVVPVLVLYLFLQKYMMKGMLAGAIKS